MVDLNIFTAFCLATLITNSACAPTPAPSNQAHRLQYVTLEEHYDSDIMIPYQTGPVIELLGEALGDSAFALVGDINETRLHSMNTNGIRIQVIPLLAIAFHVVSTLLS